MSVVFHAALRRGWRDGMTFRPTIRHGRRFLSHTALPGGTFVFRRFFRSRAHARRLHPMAAETELAFATIVELGRRLREKSVTAVELTELSLERCETLGARFNAVVTVLRESALN